MNPLISVLMPVKGPDKYLNDAITSVLQQTLADFELLLIGYPGTAAWAHDIPQDHRIKILHRDKAGIVSALNTGLSHAQGQYIARMDADDISMPNRFELQYLYLKSNPAISLAGSLVQIFNAEGSIHAGNTAYQSWLNSLSSAEDIRHSLFIESPLPHPTLFAAKSVFSSLQGYRDCQWAEDYDLLLRAHLAGFRMGKPEPILLRWRDHGSRLTRTAERYSRLNFTRAKAWALARSLARDKSVIICGIGRNAARLCDALHENGVEVRFFVEQDNAPKRHSRRNLPVITYSELAAEKQDSLLVTAVTAYGAREKLRCWFDNAGWQEFADYVIAG